MKINISILLENQTIDASMKASWDLVTFREFIELSENSKTEGEIPRAIKNIAVLSGLKPETVAQFDASAFEGLIPFLSFIDEVDSLFSRPIPKYIADLNIGLESWGKLESAKQLISLTNDIPMRAMPDVVKVYLPELDIMDQPMVKAYPIAGAFLKKMLDFFDKFKRLNDYQPSAEQKAAGLDKLNQYGFFATLHALAEGNPLNYDELLNQPADVIYQTLVMDFELSEYHKRYEDQLKSKKK